MNKNITKIIGITAFSVLLIVACVGAVSAGEIVFKQNTDNSNPDLLVGNDEHSISSTFESSDTSVAKTTTLTENGVVDYSDDANWMKLEKNPTEDVDLFFIYPTVVDESGTHDKTSKITDEVKKKATQAYKLTGSAFGSYTNVYAPYYRQIPMDQVVSDFPSYDGFLNALRNSDAKRDIFAALDYYFKNYNNGRPFILAGHSQGSALILLVLDEYMEQHPEYYKNMVAAYPLGFGLNQIWLDKNPHLKFATGETDTGVIIDYNVEGPGGTMKSMLYPNNALNINPLNWRTDETYAPASLNKGLYHNVGTVSDAQIDNKRGVVVSSNDTYFKLHPDPISICLFGDVNLHGAEYIDFYYNLAENGYKRILAFFAKKGINNGVSMLE